MGISANQTRFLSLTARQVDLEYRVQQICHNRLRLANELESVATAYNNAISNRQLFTFNDPVPAGIQQLTLSNITNLTDPNGNNYIVIGEDAVFNSVSVTAGCISGAGVDALILGTGADTRTITMSELGLDGGALTGVARESAILDAAIRRGILSLGGVADGFTQSSVDIGGEDYEVHSWLKLSELTDELYEPDDAMAQNQYDSTIDKINTRDKKLQLEQTSMEVEYKAIVAEKEAVKKILDTNVQSSFKYFS